MTLDNMDRLSNIELTLKQARAILNTFSDNFVTQTKDQCRLQIESQFETYVYSASVISDLVFKALEQIEELDSELQKERIKAV